MAGDHPKLPKAWGGFGWLSFSHTNKKIFKKNFKKFLKIKFYYYICIQWDITSTVIFLLTVKG